MKTLFLSVIPTAIFIFIIIKTITAINVLTETLMVMPK